ncbi:MAG: hypothetical protein HRS50_01285 [Mycoplasmataceae bacterium]|nr:hypothetical protein [Mycoplasmataceae bacterium]
MPELPEVETVRKYLNENILEQKIINIFLSNIKSLRNISKEKLKLLIGQKIIGTNRLAKNLIINFPGSIFTSEARKRYRTLRGDKIN